jgi:hypothetical protein
MKEKYGKDKRTNDRQCTICYDCVFYQKVEL